MLLLSGVERQSVGEIKTYVFSSGMFRVAAARAADGSEPAAQFYKELDTADQNKMRILFDYIAAVGQIKNKEKFKKIEGTDDLFQFKSHQIRMPCFWDTKGTLWITHGFRKKADRTPEADKDRAREIRDAHRLYMRDRNL